MQVPQEPSISFSQLFILWEYTFSIMISAKVGEWGKVHFIWHFRKRNSLTNGPKLCQCSHIAHSSILITRQNSTEELFLRSIFKKFITFSWNKLYKSCFCGYEIILFKTYPILVILPTCVLLLTVNK